MVLMLITLYWANLNMWINNIPLSGETYADKWHILRGAIQVALIFTALWIGKFTPFKDEIYDEKNLLIFGYVAKYLITLVYIELLLSISNDILYLLFIKYIYLFKIF